MYFEIIVDKDDTNKPSNFTFTERTHLQLYDCFHIPSGYYAACRCQKKLNSSLVPRTTSYYTEHPSLWHSNTHSPTPKKGLQNYNHFSKPPNFSKKNIFNIPFLSEMLHFLLELII